MQMNMTAKFYEIHWSRFSVDRRGKDSSYHQYSNPRMIINYVSHGTKYTSSAEKLGHKWTADILHNWFFD